MDKAKYKVLSKVFIGPPGGMEVVQPDQVIEYDGIPSIHMEPLNEAAKAAYAAMLAKSPMANRDPLAHLPKKIDPKDALVKPEVTIVTKPVPTPPMATPPKPFSAPKP